MLTTDTTCPIAKLVYKITCLCSNEEDVQKIGDEMLPHVHQAADRYQQDVGFSLTRVSGFGTDPFSTQDDKTSNEQRFSVKYPDISLLLDTVVALR